MKRDATSIPDFATVATFIGSCRIGSDKPGLYRLVKMGNGELVLQGCYTWQDGTKFGSEWRDIPTVDLVADQLHTAMKE